MNKTSTKYLLFTSKSTHIKIVDDDVGVYAIVINHSDEEQRAFVLITTNRNYTNETDNTDNICLKIINVCVKLALLLKS